jgi:ribosomal-protein-alanine N-acetyltransferase
MAWLAHGFEKCGLGRIVAVAYPENTGSWKIMEKCGMTYQTTELHYGIECVFYAITRDEFGVPALADTLPRDGAS